MEFHVELSRRATSDAEELYAWAAHRAPITAARWYARLLNTIESLNSNPRRCSVAPESDAFPEEIRQLFFGKRTSVYRVLFVVRSYDVHVLRIVRGSRVALPPEGLTDQGPDE